MIVEELKRNIEECASSQPNSLDVSFDLDSSNKPKIVKLPRQKTPNRKTSPSLRKLSSESQNLPSKSFDDSTTSIESTKFVSKKKPAKNNVAAQPGQVQKRLNLDKNCKKLGRNKSHSASNLHKLSVKDYHESFQSHGRLSSASAGKVIIEKSRGNGARHN